MADTAWQGGAPPPEARHPLTVRLALSPRFHRVIAGIPLLRRLVRGEGEALFATVAGFVRAQVLAGLVELGVLYRLAQGAADLDALSRAVQVPPERLQVLLRAAAALRLVRLRGGLWGLTTRGAAFLAVPGLADMVRHHTALYRDLADPAAFFRGGTETELARFWPYVFGAAAAGDGAAARYSRLMADSQVLVAEDTLRLISLRDRRHLMDVGGGTGAFLRAVARAYPALALTVFDLPVVLASAAPGSLAPRITPHPGSFRDDPLPMGADAISLVRVLYDHPDAVVAALLAKVQAALPPGGRLIVSEPMSGGDRHPDPSTDIYFAIYTMAMQTGRTRSAAEIARLMAAAGFTAITPRPGPRPFITSVVEARRG